MVALCCLTSQGHQGDKRGRALLAALLADAPAGLRACYIGGAHEDDPSFTGAEVGQLEKLGLRVSAPQLSDEKLDRAAAHAAIAEAEVLYLAGGDTVVLVEQVKRHDLRAAFAQALADGRLVYGVSGGTCAFAPYTIGYRDDDTAYVAACLGLGAPLPLDVHDEREDWPEMRALLELVKAERGEPDTAGLVIPSGSALIVAPDGTTSSYGKHACEVRRLGAQGQWRIDAVPATTLELPR